jgi:beta-lactamase superfamily II metal-dependent hydrolase
MRRFTVGIRLCTLGIVLVAGHARAAAPAFTPSGKLEIHYINVQQGGATLVVGPDGTTVLIDAGGNGKGSSKVVPYLQSIGLAPSDGLDYTIAGHQHSDHIGGFDEVLAAGYDVRKRNYYNGSPYASATVDAWRAACTATTAGAPVPLPLAEVIPLGNGATMTAVAVAGHVIGYGAVPGAGNNENDMSVAVLVEYGSFDFIWGSDLGGGDDDGACTGRSTTQVNVETPLALSLTPGGAWPQLSAEGVDVLHVNHHGSESSTNSDWMNRLKPEVALISVGAGQGSTWHHPRKDVVEKVLLAQASCVTAPPALVLQTEEGAPAGTETSFAGFCVGDVKIVTDGVTGYDLSATGNVSQGPDERAAAGLPRTLPVDEGPRPPTADAGADATVNEGDVVVLDGSASSDPNGDPLSFSWAQTAGPAVSLAGADTASPSFTAPPVDAATALTFALTVTDPGGLSSTDAVTVTVQNVGGDANEMYVWDQAFSQRKKRGVITLSVTVTVRRDSDADGASESGDAAVSAAGVTVALVLDANANGIYGDAGDTTWTLTGSTGGGGAVTLKFQGVPPGSYRSTVTGLAHGTYAWDASLDADNPALFGVN